STYTQTGSYDVTVKIADRGGARLTVDSTWVVVGALTAVGGIFHAPPATLLVLPVATFQDPDLSNTAGDFTAQVTWGDQHVSPGGVVNDPTSPGHFLILASNAYAVDGTYPVQVAITQQNGSGGGARSTVIVGSGIAPLSANSPASQPSQPPASPIPLPPTLSMHDGILTVVAA